MHNLPRTNLNNKGLSPGGARHRRKGDRLERELVERHRALGVHAERYRRSLHAQKRTSGLPTA
jgi:hypothetical protein